MNSPICTKCSGIFVCGGCGRSLRSQLKVERSHEGGAGIASAVIRTAIVNPQSAYTTAFEVGPRGGALVPLNAVLMVESFLPYYERETDTVWPWMPMPFDGTQIIHVAGGKRSTASWEIEACKIGACRCDDRPSGWVLPRAVARAILNVSDSFITEFGRQLFGCLPTWELQFSTPEFMKQVVFDPTFAVPTRATSRAARADRELDRGRVCRPPRPTNRRPHR